MKLGQIAGKEFQDTLEDLMKQKMPIKVAYKLKGEIDKIKQELVKYASLHHDLLIKYGRKDKDGKLEMDKLKNVKFNEEQLALFVAELKELNSIEIEVKSISVDDLGDKIDLSIDDLIMLDGLIV